MYQQGDEFEGVKIELPSTPSTMAWAGISNLASGQVFWIIFAIIEWYLAFRVFRRFPSFRRAEINPEGGNLAQADWLQIVQQECSRGQGVRWEFFHSWAL